MNDEAPEEWLEHQFETEYCAECGGDATDHEVCIVPGTGTYFARCRKPNVKLKRDEYLLLVEALRRFECFAHRQDDKPWEPEAMQEAWTGLGYATEYRPAVSAGLMRPIHEMPAPRTMGWWGLTEKGARIVLRWHRQGFGCGQGYEIMDLPPDTLCIAEEDR